jgi:hypothetical protein
MLGWRRKIEWPNNQVDAVKLLLESVGATVCWTSCGNRELDTGLPALRMDD